MMTFEEEFTIAKHTVEILKEARAKVAHGWTQRGSYIAHDQGLPGAGGYPRYCPMGAVQDAFNEIVLQRKIDFADEPVELRVVWEFLESTMTDSIPTWNDVIWRTQTEVLTAFDQAIEQAESYEVRE